MQVQNASTGSGASTPLSANVTWWYPNLPGEPPNVLHRELAVCIPSNVTIASVCCEAANGQFVTQELGNSENLDDSEVRAIYEQRYPGQNLSIPTSVRQGDLINATGAGEAGAMNWCSLPYSPLSNVALEGIAYSSGGANLGNVPQSIQDWIACFENNTSDEARRVNEAVYACKAVDLVTGGTIEGFNRTFAAQSFDNANGGNRGEPSRWTGLLGITLIVGLWTVCI
jgi:hypothetical protein